MTLSLSVKILQFLGVIYLFGVYLLVTLNDGLPNHFSHFSQSDNESLIVFNVPETVISLNLLTHLAIDDCSVLLL